MSDDEFEARELCNCPFCGMAVFESLSPEDGHIDGLIHSMPMCEKFNEMEPDDFIVAVRKEMELQAEIKELVKPYQTNNINYKKILD